MVILKKIFALIITASIFNTVVAMDNNNETPLTKNELQEIYEILKAQGNEDIIVLGEKIGQPDTDIKEVESQVNELVTKILNIQFDKSYAQTLQDFQSQQTQLMAGFEPFCSSLETIKKLQALNNNDGAEYIAQLSDALLNLWNQNKDTLYFMSISLLAASRIKPKIEKE